MRQSIRRTFLLRCTSAFAAAALACACAHPGADSRARREATELVYVGTQGHKVHALRFDPASGALTAIGVAAQGPRTTWAVAHPHLPILYAIDDDSAREGSVIAYRVDRTSGQLARIGAAPTGGKGTTYLWLDAPSMTLLAANFGSGSVSSIALGEDGRPGALVSTVSETGSGPHRRQASAHAHSVAIDPSGRYALVPDLGADRVFVYGFERATRVLAPADDGAAGPRAFAAAPGSGPRHLAFGADGRFVYLLDELSAQLMTLRWDAGAGHLSLVQSVSIDSPEFKGTPSGAEVASSVDGRMVYVANRGENSLLVYRVNPDSGEPVLVQRIASGGEAPWSFALHPSGRWMLVANQRSGRVNVFAIAPGSGLLADTGHSVGVATAVSLTFAKL